MRSLRTASVRAARIVLPLSLLAIGAFTAALLRDSWTVWACGIALLLVIAVTPELAHRLASRAARRVARDSGHPSAWEPPAGPQLPTGPWNRRPDDDRP